MINTEMLVVGGGPAGLCAAAEAAEHGAKVMLVDDKDALGGQLIKQTHMFFGSHLQFAGTRGIDIAKLLIENAKKSGVELVPAATVTGVYDDGVVTALNGGKFTKIKPEKIIVATGAYENMLAFPNSDLPGVYGAGAVQTLMNVNGVAPGNRVLMVGAGNIGLIVTYQLLQAGIDVAAVIEVTDKIGGYYVHANKIRRMGVPILTRHTVSRVWGKTSVEGATVVEVDEKYQPIPGSEHNYAVDTVCLAVGLTPLTELLWNAGCEMRYVPALGGHVAWHDENLRTSRENIYVCGDTAGIEEASSAMIEGKIAGLNAAGTLSRKTSLSRKIYDERIKDYRAQLHQLRRGPFGEKVRTGNSALTGTAAALDEPIESLPKDYRAFPKGARVVIECEQNIPCNPCETICPHQAIKVGKDIVNYPTLDPAKCTACALCLTRCPGLSLFVVNREYSPTETEISIPYEMIPLPKKGEDVDALDRQGNFVCKGKVTRVLTGKKFDRTSIVSIAVAHRYGDAVRHFRVNGFPRAEEKIVTPADIPEDMDTIICVCEDVTRRQIEKVIDRDRAQSIDEIKRLLRCGMGPCQGKTCQRLIMQILARKLGRNIAEFLPQTYRGPMKPAPLGVLAKAHDEEKN